MPNIPQPIIDAARAAQARWKIPASISLAQFGLESGWGVHTPPDSFNYFGIKALAGQPSVTVPTREVIDGKSVTINAAFRKFTSPDEAFDLHAQLLATSAHYAMARNALPDPYAFANALTGVYATDPNYGHLLGQIIRGDDLTQYDA